LARLAIIACENSPGSRELRIGRILDFFGVPWQAIEVSKLTDLNTGGLEYAVLGSIHTIAAIMTHSKCDGPLALRPTGFYAYADEDRGLSTNALQSMTENPHLSLQVAASTQVDVSVSDKLRDLTGPMAGLKFLLSLRSEDSLLHGVPEGEESKFATVISGENAQIFLRYEHNYAPVYVCSSSGMVDIDQPVGRGFYDVKDHFCSVAPLVMFITHIFGDIAWRSEELGACLIIDDPLLKPQYGFCNFEHLRGLMQKQGFTTNIAFIPWNWRRTSVATSNFFNRESKCFSISIHGCDHTGGEFGTSSIESLQSKAQLAQSRMRDHQARTGIQHDSIMIFPQGVFSSESPQVLKRNGFLAAVNTEIVPVDAQNGHTRIRDVWDVAMMQYGDFPIFTRRYGFHGLENFAFDLLLGKPCLIVAHHDAFKDGGTALVALIEKISGLNCKLHWRSLGEVVRRACRRRSDGKNLEELEMYSDELTVDNPSDRAIEVKVYKRRNHDEAPSKILCDEMPVMWATEMDHFVFGGRVGPRSENRFRLVYPERVNRESVTRSIRFELAVAGRRFLSEFRDEYVVTNRFLSASAIKLKSVLRKSN
jgi:hypothetical protein